MTPKEHLIEALRSLCAQRGADTVAGDAGISLENLKQILAGTKLPKTGEPRGVGPQLQKKLEAAFPEWAAMQDNTEEARTAHAIADILQKAPRPDFEFFVTSLLHSMRRSPKDYSPADLALVESLSQRSSGKAPGASRLN